MNKRTKPTARNKPRRIRVAALLNSAATLVAAVVIWAITRSENPTLAR